MGSRVTSFLSDLAIRETVERLDPQPALQRVRCSSCLGSQLDDPDDQGRPRVAFCGLDVDLYRVKDGLSLLRSELRRLRVPAGSVLLYELDGHEYEQDVLAE